MGMYSFFENEDIEVTDWDGLVNFLKKWKEDFGGGFEVGEMIDLKNKTFSFSSWDESKLISYWYDGTLVFLKCVSKYVEGQVFFRFENQDEAGWFEFREGECYIHTGIMHWAEWKPEENIRFELGEKINKEDKEVVGKMRALLVAHSL